MAWAEPVSRKGPRSEWRWRGRYRVRGEQHTLTKDDGSPWIFTQPAEAKRQAGKKELEARQPSIVQPGAGTIAWGEWCDEWWPKHRETLAANSQIPDDSKMRKHVRPQWNSARLDQIDQDDVQRWVNAMSKAGVSPAVVKACYNLFASSLRAAVGRKIHASPCTGIRLPERPAPDIRFLSREEFAAVLVFLEGSWRRLVLLLVATGMRWGEGAALHWQDVDATHGTITIRRAYSVHGGYIKEFPKSRRPRVVPMPEWLAEELAAWRDEVPRARRCADEHRGPGTCRSGLVVPDEHGRCLSYVTSRRRFAAAVGLAGIDWATLHDLRDTYASWLMQAGRPVEQVAELIGHTNINLTKARYAGFGSAQFDLVRAALAAPILPQQPAENVVPINLNSRSAIQKGDDQENVS